MKTQKFRISVPENYTKVENDVEVEKTFWHDIGTITNFINDDGTTKGRQLHIPAFGLKAQVFPIVEKK